MTELEPCPLCESPAKHYDFANLTRCTNRDKRGIQVHLPDESHQDRVIERWNSLPRRKPEET
jgi:hypothetical protein